MSLSFYEKLSEEDLNNLFEHSVNSVTKDFQLRSLPTSHLLADCLQAYTKDYLFNLADENKIEYKKSWKKDKLVEVIHMNLSETLAERLSLLEEETTSFMQELADGEVDFTQVDAKTGRFFAQDYHKLTQLGVLYTQVKKDEMKFIVPTEVLDFIGTEKVADETTDLLQQVEEVFKAAIHLYGAVDANRVIELWKIRYPEAAVTEEFKEELNEMLQILAIKNNYFTISTDSYASAEFENKQNAEQFKLESVEKLSGYYYVPTAQEIEYYSQNQYDYKSLQFQTLYKFAEKYSERPEEVVNIIQLFSVKGDNITMPISVINQLNLTQFPSRDAAEEFFNLAIRLQNNTRAWVNGGYTPLEFHEKFKHAVTEDNRIDPELVDKKPVVKTGARPAANVMQPRFASRSVQKQQPVRVNKIGRNEPCPCGSGKKYKKCCLNK